MEDKEQVKEQLKKEIIIETFPMQKSGGQSCHKISSGISITCPNSGFKISVDYYRSQLQNREIALTLYLLFLDEVVK